MIDAVAGSGWLGALVYFIGELVAYPVFRAVANWCMRGGQITRREADFVPVVTACVWPISLPLLAIGSVVRLVRR